MCSKFIVEYLQCKECVLLQWPGLELTGRASKATALQQPLSAHWCCLPALVATEPRSSQQRLALSPSVCRWEEISTTVCQAVYKQAVEFQPSKLSALPLCKSLFRWLCHSALLKPILPGTLWLGPSLLDQFALKLPLVWVSCSTASFLDISDMYPRHLLSVFNPFTKMGSCWPPAMSLQEQLQLTRLLITVSTLSFSFQALVYHFPGICNS